MKVLDLTNVERSDIKYKVSKFPDGQQSITLDLDNTNFEPGSQSVTIKSRLNSFLDFNIFQHLMNLPNIFIINIKKLFIKILLIFILKFQHLMIKLENISKIII